MCNFIVSMQTLKLWTSHVLHYTWKGMRERSCKACWCKWRWTHCVQSNFTHDIHDTLKMFDLNCNTLVWQVSWSVFIGDEIRAGFEHWQYIPTTISYQNVFQVLFLPRYKQLGCILAVSFNFFLKPLEVCILFLTDFHVLVEPPVPSLASCTCNNHGSRSMWMPYSLPVDMFFLLKVWKHISKLVWPITCKAFARCAVTQSDFSEPT